MKPSHHRRLDLYSELCPASSATIIGAGLVSITMGSMSAGLAFVVAGVGVGVVGTLTKSLQARRVTAKKR